MTGPTRLFAYGTLQVPELFAALCGQPDRTAQPAVLRGFERRRVIRAVYPAVVEAPGRHTPGCVWEGIDARALARLDAFEGELYVRRTAAIELDSGGRVEAWVYVLGDHARARLSDEPWDLREFRQAHAAAYIARCRGVGGGA